MREFCRRHWQKAVIALLVAWLVVVWIGNGDVRRENRLLHRISDLKTEKIQRLERELSDCRDGCRLSEFASVEHFEQWVSENVEKGQGWEWAIGVMEKANRDGYQLHYVLGLNMLTGNVEFLPATKIGERLYIIHPITGGVEEYYPKMATAVKKVR